ncbi:MAG: hypothetical protein ATN35_00750 [Epulopiscium sp. Nele67-Bin004]|nr:MAG: hypothetical protein ATN35_00750 [Epulopiscium sp. Nele67-Bin004]
MNNFFDSLNASQDTSEASIADLMSGLMMVFMVIAIAFMVNVEQRVLQYDDLVREVEHANVTTYVETQQAINMDLVAAFEGNFERYGMEIDEDSTVRFTSSDMLFATGSSELTTDFEATLREFFPQYIEILYKYKDFIKEIRIEGHTSSEWYSGTSVTDAYFFNMELSQDRTRSVLKYVMDLSSDKSYAQWLLEAMTANGLSSSRIIVDEYGVEDKEKSRRVEFKLVTNSEDVINDLIERGLYD